MNYPKKINEINNFYKQDQELYNLATNSSFQTYYNNLVANNLPLAPMNDMQQLIDSLSTWYAIKYPAIYFEAKTKKLKNLATLLDFKQYQKHISPSIQSLLTCTYTSSSFPIERLSDIDAYFYHEAYPIFYVDINPKNGLMNPDNLKKLGIYQEKKLPLNEVISTLNSKNRIDLGYTSLKEAEQYHQISCKLRLQLLKYAAYKILYNPNDLPVNNYKRLKKYLKEINQEYPDLQLALNTNLNTLLTQNYDYYYSPKVSKNDDNAKLTLSK